MATLQKRLIEVECEPIPPEDGAEWDAFCEKYKIDQLGSDRRGWWNELSTYVRGSKWVILHQGTPIAAMYDDEFQEDTKPCSDS